VHDSRYASIEVFFEIFRPSSPKVCTNWTAMNPAKQQKMKSDFFYNSANKQLVVTQQRCQQQTCITVVQVWKRVAMRPEFIRLLLRDVWRKVWLAVNIVPSIWMKYILAGQAIQISQISMLCVYASMSFKVDLSVQPVHKYYRVSSWDTYSKYHKLLSTCRHRELVNRSLPHASSSMNSEDHINSVVYGVETFHQCWYFPESKFQVNCFNCTYITNHQSSSVLCLWKTIFGKSVHNFRYDHVFIVSINTIME